MTDEQKDFFNNKNKKNDEPKEDEIKYETLYNHENRIKLTARQNLTKNSETLYLQTSYRLPKKDPKTGKIILEDDGKTIVYDFVNNNITLNIETIPHVEKIIAKAKEHLQMS